MNFDTINSPPANSAITVTVQRHRDSVQFSGASHSASQEALRKTMPMGTSPSSSVEERLASLPWQLKISPSKIEFSQERLIKVNDDEFFCRPQDVQDLSVSPDGYIMADLSGREGEESKVALTGSLSAADANWLRDTLSDLLETVDSSQHTVRGMKPRTLTGLDEQHLPSDCRLISSGSTGELAIHHLPSVDLGQKIALTVIYLVFGTAFGGIPLYHALTNLDEIRSLPLPHWVALLGVVIAIVFGIVAKRRAIAKRARLSHAEPRDQVKAVGRRVLLFGLLVIVQLSIVVFAFRNLEKLTETPFHVWLAALGLIAGIGFVSYFVWQMLWILCGRTVLIATKQLLRIQKKLVIPFSSRVIHRSELESFELMELVHVSDGKEIRYWGLEAILTNQAVRLLPKEIEFDTADWFGRTLAAWFGVPFRKAHEKEAIRSTYYEELG